MSKRQSVLKLSVRHGDRAVKRAKAVSQANSNSGSVTPDSFLRARLRAPERVQSESCPRIMYDEKDDSWYIPGDGDGGHTHAETGPSLSLKQDCARRRRAQLDHIHMHLDQLTDSLDRLPRLGVLWPGPRLTHRFQH